MNALNPPDVARPVIKGKITSRVNATLIAGADAEYIIARPGMQDA